MKAKRVEEILGRNRAWENAGKDKDKDGVSNILDCSPSNPKKQGVIHEIGRRFQIAKEERKADKASRETARSEARQITREEKAEYMKKEAVDKERSRYEKKKQYAKEGGFWGTVGKQVAKASAPAKSYIRPAPRRRAKKHKKGTQRVRRAPPREGLKRKSKEDYDMSKIKSII